MIPKIGKMSFAVLVILIIVPAVLPVTTHSWTKNYESKIRNVRQTTTDTPSCILPNYPKKGIYKVNGQIQPAGTRVSDYTVLVYECEKQYTAIPESISFCQDGNWNIEVQCKKNCRSLTSSTADFQCTYQDSNVPCDGPILSGTIARVTCKTRHFTIDSNNLFRCIDGVWDHPIPKCVAECGMENKLTSILIIGGVKKNNDGLPWHAGIYLKKRNNSMFVQICGGTIITNRLVMSGAQCFTHGGIVSNESLVNYAVGVGKYYRSWDNALDETVQKSSISRIFVPESYGGDDNNFYGDIAVLLLEKVLEFTNFVHPICIDLESTDFQNSQVSPGTLGKAVGWSHTDQSDVNSTSENLMTVMMPVIDYTNCRVTSPSKLVRYLTSDKFCAGFLNGTTLCSGDSGSGLAFSAMERGVTIWYLRGIFSAWARDENNNTCHKNTYSAFTNLFKHKDWITNLMETEIFLDNNAPTVDVISTTETTSQKLECTLPNFPEGGSYKINGVSHQPGNLVSEFTILSYECEKFHSPTPANISFCFNGNWDPEVKCIKNCKSLRSSTVDFECIYQGNKIPCDGEMVSGTVVSSTCKRRHIQVANKIRLLKCNNGEWDYPTPQCLAECGMKNLKVSSLVAGEFNDNTDVLPWYVSIYRRRDNTFDYICGGTIITNNLVISAAHCFHDDAKTIQNESLADYAVAAGKYHRSWNSPLDQTDQKVSVSRIFTPESYEGYKKISQGDIAVLLLEKLLDFTDSVLPVCLDLVSNSFEKSQVLSGVLGQAVGWNIAKGRGYKSTSESLDTVALPVVDFSTCKNTLRNANTLLTVDKFCAGYLNGTALCSGDSGSGLAFSAMERGATIWYLRGVASTGISDINGRTCQNDFYTVFTNVFTHKDFILDVMSKVFEDNILTQDVNSTTEIVSEESGCILPSFPKRGIYKVNGETLRPGARVNDFTILSYECEKNYNPSTQFSLCQDGIWYEEVQCIEAYEATTNVISTTEKAPWKCILPNLPEHGVYKVKGELLHPGTSVDDETLLSYECDKNYSPTPGKYSVCEKGTWHTDVQCIQFCDPLSSSTVNFKCYYLGSEISCNGKIPSGTVVKTTCKTRHREISHKHRTIKCIDGRWNYFTPQCVAECGHEKSIGKGLVISGYSEIKGGSPWHVGIYRWRNNILGHICGGTIITNRLVISAAHCFHDDYAGTISNESLVDFSVAAGKYYRSWDSPMDESPQKFSISRIFTPESYGGHNQNLQQDIAVLLLDKLLEFTDSVHPICLDLILETFQNEQLSSGVYGKAVGWGLTKEGDVNSASETLKALTLPVVDYATCRAKVPGTFVQYLTADKFCAGYLNGTALCGGDSGGGLVFSTIEKNHTLWYLRGIVSVSDIDETRTTCRKDMYTGFTNVFQHKNFISDLMETYE